MSFTCVQPSPSHFQTFKPSFHFCSVPELFAWESSVSSSLFFFIQLCCQTNYWWRLAFLQLHTLSLYFPSTSHPASIWLVRERLSLNTTSPNASFRPFVHFNQHIKSSKPNHSPGSHVKSELIRRIHFPIKVCNSCGSNVLTLIHTKVKTFKYQGMPEKGFPLEKQKRWRVLRPTDRKSMQLDTSTRLSAYTKLLVCVGPWLKPSLSLRFMLTWS